MAEVLNFKVDYFFKWFWGSSLIEVEREYFADKMEPKIMAIYDRMQEAGNQAMTVYQSTVRAKRLRAGLLINDMVTNMKSFRDQHHERSDLAGVSHSRPVDDSQPTKRFLHYSAHDLTIAVVLGMLDMWRQFPFRSDYASNIELELHEEAGEWYLKLFYMPHMPGQLHELHLEQCERGHPKARCTLERFEQLMSPYMIDSWQSWMKECKNDLTKIDPYAPGS